MRLIYLMLAAGPGWPAPARATTDVAVETIRVASPEHDCEEELTFDAPLPDGSTIRLFAEYGVYAPIPDEGPDYGGSLRAAALGPELATVRRALVIGSGAGIDAILLALNSNARVHATDIDPAAVRLTRKNVVHHGLGHRITIDESDLFARVSGRFDLIVFNAPRPITREWLVGTLGRAEGERAWINRICRHPDRFDPDGALITRCLREVRDHLSPRGRFLLMSEERLDAYLPSTLLDRVLTVAPWAPDPREGNFAIHELTLRNDVR